MAGPKTAEDLVNSPIVQKYINNIDMDAEAALDLLAANMKYSGLKFYPKSLISTYKADGSRLDKSWGNFNAAWNKVTFKKAKNSSELIKTYSQYVLALEILEEQNVKHTALKDADFANIAGAFCQFLIAYIKLIRLRCAELEKELIEIGKLIKKAQSEVTEAKVQVALNIALTAVSFCLGPATLGARIGVAAAGIGVHMLIDASLGPSKGSALGTANTAAGEISGVMSKLSPGAQKLAGGASAVLTLKMDFDEVDQAEAILKEIGALMKGTTIKYNKLSKLADKDGKKVLMLNKSLNVASKSADAARGKFKSSKKKREGLIKEFKQWK